MNAPSEKIIASQRLIVSFWNLCLDNLPQGHFERRTITAEEVRRMIDVGREHQTLLCVSNDDLLAPYKQKQCQKQQDLCAVLNQHHHIALHIAEFLTKTADQDRSLVTIKPLQLAKLYPGDSMLVVTCGYEFSPDRRNVDIDTCFSIAVNSVEFELITAQ